MCRGFSDEDSSTFRLEDEGPILTIKMSPDQKLFALQRTKHEVQLKEVVQKGANGALGSRSMTQACKGKTAVLIGFSWIGDTDIALFTDQSVEVYNVLLDRKTIKTVRSQSVSICWYHFCTRCNIFVTSPSATTRTLYLFAIKSGYICKVGKVDLESKVKEKDVTFCKLYNDQVYVAISYQLERGSEIHLYCVNSDFVGVTKTFILDIPTPGVFCINTVDHLVTVTHSTTSYLFDILTTGRFDGAFTRLDPICSAEFDCPTGVSFQPDIVIDAKVGVMSKIKLSLQSEQLLQDIRDPCKLVSFLQQREGAKRVLLDVLLHLLSQPNTKLKTVGDIFDLLNHEYRQHMENTLQQNLALPVTVSGSVSLKPVAKVIIDQADLYTNLFSLLVEMKEMPLKRLTAIMMQFYRSLGEFDIPAQHFLNELLINLLVRQRSWFQLHVLLQYHVISDSKPLACLLLSLENVYQPAYQLAMDMLCRLNNSNEEICEILLSKKKVMAAVIFSHTRCLDLIPPRKFLEAAFQSNNKTLFHNVYQFYKDKHLVPKEDKYANLFEQCFKGD